MQLFTVVLTVELEIELICSDLLQLFKERTRIDNCNVLRRVDIYLFIKLQNVAGWEACNLISLL